MKKKILVVDDNRLILEFMVRLLEGKGHEIVTAEDGISALCLLSSYVPDIIFVDLILPKISGHQLCRVIREMPELKHCYVVVISAAAAEIDNGLDRSSVDACIAKGPFDKMVENVLTVIKESDLPQKDNRLKKIRGLDGIHPRRMTKELLSQTRHLEAVLESISEGIVEIFSERIAYANSAAINFFGVPREKLLGAYPPDFFGIGERSKIEDLLKSEAGDKAAAGKGTAVDLNGREITLKKLPVPGEDSCAILLMSDVTELRQWEQALVKANDILELRVTERTAELSKANRQLKMEIEDRRRAEQEKIAIEQKLIRSQKMEALGLLAGGVAHDLNNVLAGSVSYPELLLLDLPADSPLKEPLIAIQDSGKKAAAIVQDLLTLARRGVTSLEVINLNTIVTEYLSSPEYELLKNYHPKVQFEISLNVDLLNMAGSQVHLKKTVMNLVSNAAEAQPDGGKVLISTENRYVDRPIKGYGEIDEGDYVVLIMEDLGSGIAPEEIHRIFEPFYTKKVMGRSGTGLGMAVVWGTVQDHHGYIDIESAEDQGTTFKLYFPVVREEVALVKTCLPIEDYMGDGEQILVIDDVEAQRKIASSLLSKLGYSVKTVSGGESAVEFMKSGSADILLLDMIMEPGIDGLETYRRILQYHPNQKAVIASGFSETEQVKDAQRLGVAAYIKKPYTMEQLGLVIKRALNM
jgi:PAS domain S-box-containing protein